LKINNTSTSSNLYYDVEVNSKTTVNDFESYSLFAGSDKYFDTNSSGYPIITESNYESYYDLFFYKTDDGSYDMYAFKRGYTIRLYSNDDFKKNVDSDNFLDLNVTNLIWQNTYAEVDDINDTTNSISSDSKGVGSFSSTAFMSAIENYASSYNYTGSYIIRDYASNLVVGFYCNKKIEFYPHTVTSGNTEFYVIKSAIFYLEESDYKWAS